MTSMSKKLVIIIKTPNQRIADHRFDVDSQSTTAQLKELLSTEYPSQPAVPHQKLIYGGQLMKDSVRLDEILKNIDQGENVHTVHLVCASNTCTTPSNSASHSAAPPLPSNASPSENAELGSNVQQSDNAAQSSSSTVADERLHSASTSQGAASTLPWESVATSTFSWGQPILPFYATQPNVWYLQCYQYAVAMQQQYYAAYADYVRRLATQPNAALATSMMQFNATQGFVRPPVPQAAPAQVPPAPAPAPANADANAAPAPAPAAAPGADPRVLNAQGGVDDGDADNEGAPNDWFDVAYLVLKVALLISMFYSYSSWDKVMIGIALFALVYALQRGVQRAVVVRPPVPAAQAAAVPNVAERPNADGHADLPAAAAAPPALTDEPVAPAGLTSVMRVCVRIFDTFCAFFVTFITSLLPERAPPIVGN